MHTGTAVIGLRSNLILILFGCTYADHIRMIDRERNLNVAGIPTS